MSKKKLDKKMEEAIARIDKYSEDMKAGKIDMSECVKLSHYPPFKAKHTKVVIEEETQAEKDNVVFSGKHTLKDLNRIRYNLMERAEQISTAMSKKEQDYVFNHSTLSTIVFNHSTLSTIVNDMQDSIDKIKASILAYEDMMHSVKE